MMVKNIIFYNMDKFLILSNDLVTSDLERSIGEEISKGLFGYSYIIWIG
jgi:hypothetical protein